MRGKSNKKKVLFLIVDMWMDSHDECAEMLVIQFNRESTSFKFIRWKSFHKFTINSIIDCTIYFYNSWNSQWTKEKNCFLRLVMNVAISRDKNDIKPKNKNISSHMCSLAYLLSVEWRFERETQFQYFSFPLKNVWE